MKQQYARNLQKHTNFTDADSDTLCDTLSDTLLRQNFDLCAIPIINTKCRRRKARHTLRHTFCHTLVCSNQFLLIPSINAKIVSPKTCDTFSTLCTTLFATFFATLRSGKKCATLFATFFLACVIFS